MEFAGYVSAILMGLTMGLVGAGGSILTVPILVYFFSQDPVTATTGSLFVVGITAAVGSLKSFRQKNVALKAGVLFAIPSFAGVFVSRRFILPNLPDVLYLWQGFTITKGLVIMSAFAVLMILAARAMIGVGSTNASPQSTDHSVANIAWNGFFVGITTGFVGAGGGFLILPALVILLKLSMRIAIGTSLTIVAANSLFGFAISFGAHVLNWQVLFVITGLGVAGMFAGQLLSASINERALKKGFGYFVLLIGSLVLVEQFFQ